jgi:ribose transport system substrate-binding protein
MGFTRGHGSSPTVWLALLALVVSSVALSACGSSKSSNSTASTGPTGHTGSAGANQAAASERLAPYVGHPSAFPVDAALARKPSPGSTFEFLQCATSTCGLASEALAGAAKTLGVKFKAVKAGASASEVQNAMGSIVASHPAAFLSGGIELSGVGSQLKQLTSQGVAVSTFGALDAAEYGVQAPINGSQALQLDGALMAAWAVEKKGGAANVVLYTTPELQPSIAEKQGFDAELAKLCPGCSPREVHIPFTEYGTTAPSTIVSDLQSHPSTNVAAFVTGDQAVGLPSALKTAGLTVLTIATGPVPANLSDIKSGGLTAGIGVDIPVMLWTCVDAAARVATGQQLTAGEKAGIPPIQLLEKADITFDPAHGWTGYPDFVERFAKLWNGKG